MNQSNGEPLHIQNYLRAFTVERLEEEFGIKAVRSVKYPELIQFKYDQINSPPGAPIVKEARGIILNEKDNWAIIAHPFHRFYNLGDPHADQIDLDTIRVQEKLDGSLIIMYWYGSQWNAATSGNPDAAGNVNGFDMTFETLFWDTFRVTVDVIPFNPSITYMWELTSPYNKIVVQHKEAKVTLIGMRDVPSGREIPIKPLHPYIPTVKSFSLKSLSEVLAACKELKGFEQEGFVVVDGNFNRVKVKGPHYVMLHHTRDSMSPKGFVDVIRNGESDEFLAYFPEFADLFNSIKLKYQTFVGQCDSDWYSVTANLVVSFNGIGNPNYRKDFAGLAAAKRLPGYLFARLDGKVPNCAEYLKKLPIDNVMRLLELK